MRNPNLKTPILSNRPRYIEREKPSRGPSADDLKKEVVRQRVDLFRDARELGDRIMEVWE